MMIIVIAVVAGVLQLFLPWWSALLAAGVLGGWMASWRGEALRNGALGVGLLWLGYAGYLNWMNDGILSERIANMIGLPGGIWMVLLTLVLGLITGLIGSWVGYELHDGMDKIQNK
jgi:hypothetical protein